MIDVYQAERGFQLLIFFYLNFIMTFLRFLFNNIINFLVLIQMFYDFEIQYFVFLSFFQKFNQLKFLYNQGRCLKLHEYYEDFLNSSMGQDLNSQKVIDILSQNLQQFDMVLIKLLVFYFHSAQNFLILDPLYYFQLKYQQFH